MRVQTSSNIDTYLTTFKWPYFSTAYCYVVGPAGSPTCTVFVDVTLTRSKVEVKVTGLLNFRQLAKPCMLAAMTAAPLRGFLVFYQRFQSTKTPVFVRKHLSNCFAPHFLFFWQRFD